MKTFLTIISVALMFGAASAQTKQAASSAPAKSSVMVYSEEEEALVYRDDATEGHDIFIESLPEYGSEAIPVEINQAANGSYTFKKHPALSLPEYYSVVITDRYTGENFDLKAADSYTFQAKKDMPERFVLQMSKMKTVAIAMR